MSETTGNIEVYSNGVLVLMGKHYRCALGRTGVVAAEDKKEGDGTSPAGTYPMRMVYYRPDTEGGEPQTSLRTQALSKSDGWSDDVNDPDHYNTFVPLPYPGSHEELWRGDHLYNLIVPLGYNDNPVQVGKGSAIFMHVAREAYTPTAGCIALAEDDLREVLSLVNSDTQVVIHQEATS